MVTAGYSYTLMFVERKKETDNHRKRGHQFEEGGGNVKSWKEKTWEGLIQGDVI